jgi:hypothetical protein
VLAGESREGERAPQPSIALLRPMCIASEICFICFALAAPAAALSSGVLVGIKDDTLGLAAVFTSWAAVAVGTE